MTVQTLLLLVAVSGLTFLGDWAIKLASERDAQPMSAVFILGATLYALPAVGWFYLMRSHSLATIGVLYSASTVLLLVALGVLVFREAFTWREALGVVLALSAVAVVGLQD